MNKKIFLVTLIVLALVVTSWTPAPAASPQATTPTTTSTLTIKNGTTKMVTITMTGPKPYTFYVVPGVTTQTIAKGVYKYTYMACGLKKTGVLKATSTKVKININKCPTTNLLIVNTSDSMLTVRLTGPDNYNFTIPANSSFKTKITKGVYKYSATWCGQTQTGTLRQGNLRWTFWCN